MKKYILREIAGIIVNCVIISTISSNIYGMCDNNQSANNESNTQYIVGCSIDTLEENHQKGDAMYLNGIPVIRNYNDDTEVYPPQDNIDFCSDKRNNGCKKFNDISKKQLPPKTIFNNIVIFIRFKDEEEFINPDVMKMYQDHYNGDGFSLKKYMSDISYGQYIVNTEFFPKNPNDGNVFSYQTDKTRGYYRPYRTNNPSGYLMIPSSNMSKCKDYANIKQSRIKEKTRREHQLLLEAVCYCKKMIEESFPNADDLDCKNKNTINNIIFVLNGPEDGYDDIFWPHQWSLSQHKISAENQENVSIHNKGVDLYNLMLHGCFQENNIGTTVHEFLHINGFPDLYRCEERGEPVNRWDLMSLQYPIPQFPTVYSRSGYGGFCDMPTAITCGGKYTIFPSNIRDYECNISYRLVSPFADTNPDEYFVIEYRNPQLSADSSDLSRYCPWDRGLPDSGLLVYRINNQAINGNIYGGRKHPDNVYIFRKGVTDPYRADGDILKGALLHDGQSLGVLNCTSSDSNDHTLGEKIYFSNGENSGIRIYDIETNADKSISFRVEFDETNIKSFDIGIPDSEVKIDNYNKKILIKMPESFMKRSVCPYIETNGKVCGYIPGDSLYLDDRNKGYTIESSNWIRQEWNVIFNPISSTSDLRVIHAKANDNLTIGVSVINCFDNIKYKWYEDGQLLEGETSETLAVTTDAQDGSMRTYTAVAYNEVGETKCPDIVVEVDETDNIQCPSITIDDSEWEDGDNYIDNNDEEFPVIVVDITKEDSNDTEESLESSNNISIKLEEGNSNNLSVDER